MPRLSPDLPENLRPYAFHGMDINWSPGAKQATAECPWCREEKFTIEAETGKWRCFHCTDEGGNLYTFLRRLWDESSKRTSAIKLDLLATQRKLLSGSSLMKWGAAQSILDATWLLPGYNVDGAIIQLYRYTTTGGRYVLMATPTLHAGLFGVPLFNRKAEKVYLAEGPWDGIALWEVLRQGKVLGTQFTPTASEAASLLAKASVLAVPGCSTFSPGWSSLFARKEVILLYDNDHPPSPSQLPASLKGMERVAKTLSGSSHPPKSIHYLQWGDKGVDKSLPHGWDVRDHLTHI